MNSESEVIEIFLLCFATSLLLRPRDLARRPQVKLFH